jgi:peptide/nickel transport system substrate-binding protein
MLRRFTLFVLAALLVAPAFAADTPTAGGTAIVVLGSDPEHLNTAISTSYPIGAVGASLYSALVYLDADGVPHGELASAWTVSPDDLTYTFTLRPATFHDGTPLTSADVVHTMVNVLAPNHGRFQTAFRAIESITAPDAATVVIRLTRPYAPLIGLLTVFDAPILPKHLYEGTDPLANPVNQAPVGSGPFRFVEWVRGERVVLERFDGYFGEPALLDRLIYRIVPQDVARSVALEVGDADLVWGFYMPTADLARLESNPNVDVWKGLTIPSLFFMFMNHAHPALADVRVRQALMHAIDREQIVEQAQGGLGQVAAGPFGAGFSVAYDEATDYRTLYPYDPERARALLAEAGYASGLTFDFELPEPYATERRTGEIIAQQLRDVGITVNLSVVEWGTWIQRIFLGGDYDMTIIGHSEPRDINIYANPQYYYRYDNQAVRDLLAAAEAAPSAEAETAAYQEIARTIAQDAVNVWVFSPANTVAARADLEGYWINQPTPAIDLTEVFRRP